MDWFLYDNGLRHERVKDIAGCASKWCVKTQLLSFNHSSNSSVIDVQKDGSANVEKLFFKMPELFFTSKSGPAVAAGTNFSSWKCHS